MDKYTEKMEADNTRVSDEDRDFGELSDSIVIKIKPLKNPDDVREPMRKQEDVKDGTRTPSIDEKLRKILQMLED